MRDEIKFLIEQYNKGGFSYSELEFELLDLFSVVRSEQLIAFGLWLDKNDKHLENGNITETVKEYIAKVDEKD